MEIVFGSEDHSLYILKNSGGGLWRYSTNGAIKSSPAIADIDSDKILDIVIGSDNNKLYALDYRRFKIWSYQTNDDVTSTPAVGDIDGDGRMEIIICSNDGRVYYLHYIKYTAGKDISMSKLSPGWTYRTENAIISSPAIADLDGDGNPEIIIGSMDRNLYILTASGELIRKYTTNGKIRSSPAVADLDGDGNLEIIFGSDDNLLYVLNSSGYGWWHYKTNGSIRSSPAVADLDGDGNLEIVIGSEDKKLYVFSMGGLLEEPILNLSNETEIEITTTTTTTTSMSTTITTSISMSTTITTSISMSTTIETQSSVSRGYGTIIVAIVIILVLIGTFLVLKGKREEVIDYKEIVDLSIKNAKSRIMEIENPDYDKILELERADKNRKSFVSWLERRKRKVVR